MMDGGELALDQQVRDWVVVPLTISIVLMKLIMQYLHQVRALARHVLHRCQQAVPCYAAASHTYDGRLDTAYSISVYYHGSWQHNVCFLPSHTHIAFGTFNARAPSCDTKKTSREHFYSFIRYQPFGFDPFRHVYVSE